MRIQLDKDGMQIDGCSLVNGMQIDAALQKRCTVRPLIEAAPNFKT